MRFLAVIDRALRKPGSASVLACIGAVAAVAVLTLVFEKYELQANLACAAVLAGLGVWTVDAWRRLWRVGNGPWEELVFNVGVRRLGPAFWLVFVTMLPFWLAYESQHSWRSFAAVATFFFVYALFTLPAWLWTGYLWGRSMAKLLGITKPPSKID